MNIEEYMFVADADEKAHGRFSESSVDHICAQMMKIGAVGFNGIFATEFIDQLYSAYVEQYESDRPDVQANEVGDRRRQAVTRLENPFDNNNLLSNSYLTPVLQHLLGDDYILASSVLVTSYPGAKDQHIHRDYPPLFDDYDICNTMPTYAVTLSIPLVLLSPLTGTTRVYPGTHHNNSTDEGPPTLGNSISVLPDYGGCYLFDAQVRHGGTANLSDLFRPILYLVFARSWWRDAYNFGCVHPVNIGASSLAGLSDDTRRLFRFCTPTG